MKEDTVVLLAVLGVAGFIAWKYMKKDKVIAVNIGPTYVKEPKKLDNLEKSNESNVTQQQKENSESEKSNSRDTSLPRPMNQPTTKVERGLGIEGFGEERDNLAY